ncbi:MAG: PAS domain S-box protein, partial [Anaerolineae bacterium]|nr:PAS domain S-box protein [Anaerolineae bacterium]
EQAAVGMAHVSLDGRWLRVNQRLCHIVGYSRQELLARTFQQITHPADLELDLVYHRQLLAGQITTYTLEKRYLRKAGGSVWIELTVSLRRSETGEPLHVIAVVQDITARKEAQATRAQLEEQLRQAQKMESIGRLAGGVAHDFNNLLTVIQGYSEFMQKQLPADHPTRRSLTQILRASNSATALTRQLLAFSRKQHLTPTILDLNDLIDNLQKMLRRLIGEDIELVTELYAGLWSVLADPSQLEQVLLNLAINARDAMPTGGTLTISTANVDLSKPEPTPHREASSGPMVRLTVSDTGQGMDAQTREQIFEPFFTTKQAGQGTGLGLAMVYGTIKQSGGDIMVSSEVGQGSTFDIYLPSAEKQLPDHLLDPITKREVPGGGETILLVEDESVVREITAVILEDAGYTLLVASRGEAALALNEHHPGSIDLLITDVIMPEMSGPALTEQLIVYHPALKVLYISGYPDEAINRYGLFANQVELLTKPFTPTALLTKVRQVLDGAAPAAA